MSFAPPPLPTRFPCWCRAVYSWGGETKRDLGFMEGDLIECLNAGDGSWWTGRLYRDRRTVGIFPSNFVQVLPDDFRPMTRSVSPLPSNTSSPRDTPPKKSFRRPFEAYSKAPHYTTAKQPETFHPSAPQAKEGSSKSVSKGPRQRIKRAASPAPPTKTYDSYRAPSPSPLANSYDPYRAPSPAPPTKSYDSYRTPSPAPPMSSYDPYRAASPAPPMKLYDSYRDTSPLSPMTVRDSYRATSPAPPMQSYGSYRAHSPAPPMHAHPARGASSMPPQAYSRAPSPAPPHHAYSRAPSPAPPPHAYSRAPSPAPPPHAYSRAPSPAPPTHSFASRAVSPAPPPHGYPSRAVSPAPPPQTYTSGAVSPAPSFNPYQPHPQMSQDSRTADAPPPPPPPHRHVARRDSTASHNPLPPSTPRHDSNASYNPLPPSTPRHSSNASYSQLPPSTPRRDSNASPHRYQPSPGFGRPGSNTPHELYPAHLSRHGSSVSYDPRDAPAHLSRNGSTVSYDPRQAHPDSLNTSQNGGYQIQTPRAASPIPPSPSGSHMTPSPLREAMDGVMEQLDALGMPAEPESPAVPIDPWSPECFDMVSRQPRKKTQAPRPHTAAGYPHADEGYETFSGESSQDPSYVNGQAGKDQPAPELSNYVNRMENQLRQMHGKGSSVSAAQEDEPPPPPPKSVPFERPKSSMGAATGMNSPGPERKLKHRKSAYDVGREVLGRTFTTKTNATNSSSGTRSTATNTTQASDRSLMSGSSAGAISATSAGSYARKRDRAQSALGMRDTTDSERPDSPFTGVTYHSSHASGPQRPLSQAAFHDDGMGIGGLVQPKAPRRSIFKKIFASAKTGVASGRSNIATGEDSPRPLSPVKTGPSAIGTNVGATRSMPQFGGNRRGDLAREMGLGNSVDWVQVRRDVNRSNSLSFHERVERRERAQMLDYPAINATEELFESVEGDEGIDGMPVGDPINYQTINLGQVDKNTRFIANLPPTTTAITLATTYVCRPYRSDAQRLRAIFTYASEKVLWEEDFEGEIDTRRVIQSGRGCPKEVAVLVMEMCAAVGIECEVVRGYLKTPGEIPEVSIMPRSNHWWNAVAVDGQWRVMDCSLAAPSNPRRAQYSSSGSSTADPWWFLARPTEICWTHIPEHHAQQHVCPPVAHEILLNLPCACPPFFRNGLEMSDYNSSLTRIEDLEMVHVEFSVPADVEVAAEVEVRAFTRDLDGDVFESGDTVKKRALAQAEWRGDVKRYTIKALLPGDEGQGVLKVYAGKRGLMHSIKDIPHPLAFALPVIHTGENPEYDFVTRHPTPHAQRHDIYVAQPQCRRLALNNTFVFAVRQHPSAAAPSGLTPSSFPGDASPIPFARPSSVMSITASSASSNPSSSASGSRKPAKLAIQTPAGKILRLMRKDGKGVGVGSPRGGEEVDGGTWETIIKCGERGNWRGLVLADRTARWCVFAEWVCE